MPTPEAEAMARIAAALEFFVGVHPAYAPKPGEKPLPSSPQAKAIEDARLKAEADAKAKADAVESAKAKAAADERVRLAHEEADRLAQEQKDKAVADKSAVVKPEVKSEVAKPSSDFSKK